MTKKTPTMEKQFQVKTRGYNETFGSQADAKKRYDELKKKAEKTAEGTKLELIELGSDGKGGRVLESVKFSEEFFG